MKRLAMGCGGFLALLITLGLVAGIAAITGKSDPADFTKMQSVETFSANAEGALKLPGGDQPSAKPVRLVLDMNMVEFKLKAHDEPGQLRVEGEYDKANYELSTVVKEKKDRIEYRLGFKSRHNLLGLLAGSDGTIDPNDNKVVLYVPRDLLLELSYKFDIAEAEFDLTGLAVRSLEGRISKGRIDISMEEPNQTRMATFDVKSSMGDMTLLDVQNYRYKEGRAQGNMGAIRLDHSGLYEEDARLVVRMSMGDVRFRKPPNTNLDQKLSTLMGGIHEAEQEAFRTDQATFTLAGRVTMGDFRATKNALDHRVSILYSKLRKGETDQVLADYKSDIAARPQKALSVDEMNTMGRWLWNRELEEKTYAVFALNEELHPADPEVFRGQARFFKRYELYDKALAKYEQAAAMEPEDTGTNRQMARLKLLIAEQKGN